MKILKIEDDGDYDLLVTVQTGFWIWKKQRKLHGSCTVWHWLPNFRRASTWVEAWLAEV